MATEAATTATPQGVIWNGLHEIPEIEQVYVLAREHALSVLEVVDQPDHAVERRIFRREAEIINALPGIAVSFELVFRCGRPLGQVITPRGNLLFSRS